LLLRTGGADGGVVLGVREQHDPVVADELVEVDSIDRVRYCEYNLACVFRLRAASGLGLEVGGDGAEAERLRTLGGTHCA
jgi:hypothetical protein